MKCGNCHRDHGTVQEVKECYGLTHGAASAPTEARPATPRTNPARDSWPFPEGHYAIPGANGRDIDFYRIQKPTEGKWKGWTFLSMVIGGKPDASIRDWARARLVFEQIAKDPQHAAWLYGTQIGQCDKCNRHLTDETSRQHGRGPECRNKYGPGFFSREAA